MKNFLGFCRKGKSSVITFCLIGIVIFSGCGKDDKDVVQNPLSYPFDSTGQIVDTYLANSPTNLQLTDDATGIKLTWLTPANITDLTLSGYNIYSSKDGGYNYSLTASVGLVNTYTDTTATVVGTTYFFQMTSVFIKYETVGNFYTSGIESRPTEAKSRKK
ncbi:MAG: hypothetical protein AB1498_03885 [bacterium]